MAKVMIIDDSGLSRKMMRAILEPAGHDVLDAVDGMSGIEQYFLEKPDLVTLDLTMKGMHGLEVLEKLRAMDPKAKVLVASADIQRSTQELALKGGAVGFLTKPLTKESVLLAVEQALKEKNR